MLLVCACALLEITQQFSVHSLVRKRFLQWCGSVTVCSQVGPLVFTECICLKFSCSGFYLFLRFSDKKQIQVKEVCGSRCINIAFIYNSILHLSRKKSKSDSSGSLSFKPFLTAMCISLLNTQSHVSGVLLQSGDAKPKTYPAPDEGESILVKLLWHETSIFVEHNQW